MSRLTQPSLSSVSSDIMIDVQGVVKVFKNAAGEFTVLKGLDLTLKRGEFVAIVGKSGSGKSTLLNMMTGIDHPTAGKVIIADTDLYAMTESQRSLWRGKNMGIVFQFFQLLPMLTLVENVMLPMDYVNMLAFDERPARAMELLKMVGLEKQAHKLPSAVSTGQQQLTAIARALATDPSVLVADEPTGNLDTRSADQIIELFQGLVAQGKTVVMVTHDPSLTEKASRTIIISDGELVDETVALALPLLSHRKMLEVAKATKPQVFQAGEAIIRQAETVNDFFMISSGVVEIVMRAEKSKKAEISSLSRGEFFGEIELLRGGKAIASVRASSAGPVEVLALPRAEFLALLNESPLTEAAIGQMVQNRLGKNRSVDSRKLISTRSKKSK